MSKDDQFRVSLDLRSAPYTAFIGTVIVGLDVPFFRHRSGND